MNTLHPSTGPYRGEAIPRVDFGRVSVFLGEKNGKFPDANLVLLRGREVRGAFDAPLVSNRIGAEFDATDLVMMSHAHEDHMAGLHRLPRAKVQIHEADLGALQSRDGLAAAYGIEAGVKAEMFASFQRDFHYAPRPDATAYDDGATWNLGGLSVEAIHMPGHTAGHTALLVKEESLLFIGDVDLSGFGPYYGDASSSLADFRRTLARLPEIPAKIWVTAHHRGIYTDRAAFLNDLAAYAAKLDRRERRLIELLRASPRTLKQLAECRVLYPQGYEAIWVEGVESRTISRHLAELIEAGRVTVDDDAVYRLA